MACAVATAVPHHRSQPLRRRRQVSAQISAPAPPTSGPGMDDLADIQRAAENAYGPIIEKDENLAKPRIVVLGSGWAAYSFCSQLDSSACARVSNYFRYIAFRSDASANPFCVLVLWAENKQTATLEYAGVCRYDVIVVSPRSYFVYTPLLPGCASGTVEERSIVEPIRNPLSKKGFNYYEAYADNVDPRSRLVQCKVPKEILSESEDELFQIRFDFCIVAVGSVPNTFGVPGVQDHAVFFKEMEDAARLRRELNERLERASLPGTSSQRKDELLNFVFVGAGPTGIELAAELYDTFTEDVSKIYSRDLLDRIQITVVDLQERVLSAYDKSISEYTQQAFQRNGIKLQLNQLVKEVRRNELLLEDRSSGEQKVLQFGLCVWSAGFQPHPLCAKLLQNLPHEVQNQKFIKTDKSLRVFGAQNIFAAGDAATVERPKSLAAAEEMFQEARTAEGRMTKSELKQLLRRKSSDFPHLDSLADNLDEEYADIVPEGQNGITFEQFQDLLRKVDSQLRSFPLTAQVAAQEGKFLGNLFNQAIGESEWLQSGDLPQFKYKHKGQLAYIGKDNAVAEIMLPARAKTILRGLLAGIVWKGFETWSQFRLQNKVLVAIDFLRTRLFGRDVSRIR